MTKAKVISFTRDIACIVTDVAESSNKVPYLTGIVRKADVNIYTGEPTTDGNSSWSYVYVI